nr:hypothetical protein [Sinorhizobium meliloti]
MARSKIIYTLKEIADMIGENLELLEDVINNSDNIAKGEMIQVRDGSDGTRGLTGGGVQDLQELLADIRTWDNVIRQFLIDEQCDPEMIERIMADEYLTSYSAQALGIDPDDFKQDRDGIALRRATLRHSSTTYP